MAKIEVPVSDGGTVAVRPLFLYEDDAVPFDDPGDFVVNYVLDIQSGQVEPVTHTLADFSEIPKKPNKPREGCLPGSVDFDEWASWTLYHAIVHHELHRLELAEQHAHNIARYVLAHCLSETDRQRIVNPDDLAAVLVAALAHSEVTLQDIETVLESTFQGVLQWAAHFASHILAAGREKEPDQHRSHSLLGLVDPAGVAH